MSSHISTIVEPMNKILAVNPKYKSTGKVKKWCSSKGITKTTWVDSNVSSNPIIGGGKTNRWEQPQRERTKLQTGWGNLRNYKLN